MFASLKRYQGNKKSFPSIALAITERQVRNKVPLFFFYKDVLFVTYFLK